MTVAKPSSPTESSNQGNGTSQWLTDARIESLEVSCYTVPTDAPESDGTLEWNKTTIVIVQALAGGVRGLGYTYADGATAQLIRGTLAEVVYGHHAMDITETWTAMVVATRNLGRPGIVSMAISAVDNALWDLKAKLLKLPLVKLLGAVRDVVPVYGSGGFTSYSIGKLQEQLSGWAKQGIAMVKMKVGRDPAEDLNRVRAARDATGRDVQLFVDANGAYTRKQALFFAERFAQCGVTWFEEPVTSDDTAGLRIIRDHAPAEMEIAAGEYGYDASYFRNMLASGAVDVLQADATRCAGVTGFLQASALCEANKFPLSAHTAPSIHAHVCCAVPAVRHLEYFHDHVRIDKMFFDGVLEPIRGALRPDLNRLGFGLDLKKTLPNDSES